MTDHQAKLPSLNTLIPHQPPMRLIDQVLAFDEHQVWATVNPSEDCIFATPAGIPACLGLEYLAQTAAAFFSLQASTDRPPRAGKLVACQKLITRQAYFAFLQPLLLRVTLTSRLPPVVTQQALVKFAGAVFPAPTALPKPGLPEQLADMVGEPICTAELSVYL